MNRALALAALCLLTPLPAMAQTARAPIGLPAPPPVTTPAGSALFDAMLAISRAQQTNPQAAQTASFRYVQGVQQYRSGDFRAARRSALEAASVASQAQSLAPAPAPAANLAPSPAQLPGTQGGLYGADAPAIDADSFLALARGLIGDCAARRDPRLPAARQHLADAQRAYLAGHWQATRMAAKAAIDACALVSP